jgi:uncharacterized membrane protein YhdT
MNIQITQAIKQGLEIIIKNPAILVVIISNAVLFCVFFYFFVYIPQIDFLYTSPMERLALTPGEMPEMPEMPEYFGLYSFLLSLISLFLGLIIVKMVYDIVKNNKVSLSETISLLARKFIFVFIAYILYSLILILGLIALIIPGIFFSVKFVFVIYLILLNNEKIIDSFKKSWQITKGHWWGIFGLFAIFMIPISILSIVARIIAIPMGAIQTALILDFISLLLSGWAISAFTIAYIQLTKQENKEK